MGITVSGHASAYSMPASISIYSITSRSNVHHSSRRPQAAPQIGHIAPLLIVFCEPELKVGPVPER